ncbi:hypothetical protein Sango_2091800 [Sesamum angolense]|uniref:Uncharacterized protein n=1 Tax=Sesamum angolense TaxID=2727404 RepID=A0AAE1WBJ9_9LAMI|nr:hypothetical protein Sango_2091800 [Sesamum angolense]
MVSNAVGPGFWSSNYNQDGAPDDEATAEQIMWHANHQIEEGSMCHSSDAEAWRYFDQRYPDFAVEPPNVRLVFPGPSNLKCLIDVYLEWLIEEFQNLWHVAVLTCDSAKTETFMMRAALMWIVNRPTRLWDGF